MTEISMNLSRRRFLSRATATAGSSVLMATLSGCSAVTAVSRASDPLAVVTLTNLPVIATTGAGRGHLVVELPSTGGALATDRILIAPSPRQAEYLPGARWAEPLPAMIQTLLVNSVLNQGGFRLVSRVGAGLRPDYTLMTEIQAFQAEVLASLVLLAAPVLVTEPVGGPPAPGQARLPEILQVRIALQMTMIRERDRAVVAARQFAGIQQAPSDSTTALIAGLDAAMQVVLRDVVAWVRTVA